MQSMKFPFRIVKMVEAAMLNISAIFYLWAVKVDNSKHMQLKQHISETICFLILSHSSIIKKPIAQFISHTSSLSQSAFYIALSQSHFLFSPLRYSLCVQLCESLRLVQKISLVGDLLLPLLLLVLKVQECSWKQELTYVASKHGVSNDRDTKKLQCEYCEKIITEVFTSLSIIWQEHKKTLCMQGCSR